MPSFAERLRGDAALAEQLVERERRKEKKAVPDTVKKKKMKFKRVKRMMSGSWAYRIRRICYGLGWSLQRVADVAGLSFDTIFKLRWCHKDPKEKYGAHYKTIRGILEIEKTYEFELNQFDRWPARWKHLRYTNRVEVRRPQGLDSVEVLGPRRRIKTVYKSKKNKNFRVRSRFVRKSAFAKADRPLTGKYNKFKGRSVGDVSYKTSRKANPDAEDGATIREDQEV